MRARLQATAVGLMSAGAVCCLAGPAAADVSVSADTLTPGATSAVTVRVINERTAADLTAVRVEVPAGVGSVTAGQLPGWTAEVSVPAGNAPATVRWTATTAPLSPGRFADFTVLLQVLPQQRSASFPTVETYRDGDEIRWGVGDPGPGVMRRAPTLTLAGVDPAEGTVAVGTSAATSAAGTDGAARLRGMAAILIGLIGCGVVAQGVRGRPPAAGTATMLGIPARLFPVELSRPLGPVRRSTDGRPDGSRPESPPADSPPADSPPADGPRADGPRTGG